MRNEKQGNAHKIFLLTGCLTAWFALIAQLYLIISNHQISVMESVTRYFSYFTILTNVMVALCFTSLLSNFRKEGPSFFSKPNVLAAITLYITVVGIVYNLILRFTWQPQGLQHVVDELLHLFIPVLFLVYWFIFAPKSRLKWADALTWLRYPFIYLVFVLTRGHFSGFYPYPFLNVVTLDYQKVMINSFYLLIVFLVLSLLLVWIGKRIAKP